MSNIKDTGLRVLSSLINLVIEYLAENRLIDYFISRARTRSLDSDDVH